MTEQERGDALGVRMKEAGYTLGSHTTCDALEAFLDGKASELKSYNGVLLKKEDWIASYVKRMVDLNVATPGFAATSAEQVFSQAIHGSYLPQDAADIEIARWG